MAKFSKAELLEMAGIYDIKNTSIRELEETLANTVKDLIQAASLLEASGAWVRDKNEQEGYELTPSQKAQAHEIMHKWGD